MNQRVIISTHLEGELVSALAECEHDKLFVLTDTTTQKECLPLLKKFYCMKEAQVITIPATDSHKDIESLMMVWKGLQEGGASRHSCMINLGGGMVTDLGGLLPAPLSVASTSSISLPPCLPCGCFGGRKDRYQLRRSEERSGRFQRL